MLATNRLASVRPLHSRRAFGARRSPVRRRARSSPGWPRLNLLPVEMVPDSTRNGTIDDNDKGKISEKEPWSFWLNDDDDTNSDPLGPQRADHTTGQVDGAKDLEDFFPVFLDIQQLVKALPPDQTVKYKLKQADGAVNLVETNLSREAAFSYKDSTGIGYGIYLQQHAASATTTQITAAGVELSEIFLNNIKNDNKGVILLEGRAPTTKPLVLSVEKAGVQVAEVSLPLSLAPRILLLLHGMNSNTDTWQTYVDGTFFATGAARSMVIRDEGFRPVMPATLPSLNSVPGSFGKGGARCYRLQFGSIEDENTATTGLENLKTVNAEGGVDGVNQPYLTTDVLKCGDFETFDELAQEVDDAITMLLARHPGAQIVLVGHSRGGLAGRKFLEGSSTNKDAVVGFLTTASLHKGSPMGRIYQWLDDHRRGAAGSFSDDWEAVDFLREPTFWHLKNKPTLDVRRPVIHDMSDSSTAITTLNNPTQVARLPSKVVYGEIIYSKVKLGVLASGVYSVFDEPGIDVGEQVSAAAKTYILGAGNTPASFPGDGLIPQGNQHFTELQGFPAPGYPPAPAPAMEQNTIPRRIVTNEDVVHTDAPLKANDLRLQLRQIVPSWFP